MALDKYEGSGKLSFLSPKKDIVVVQNVAPNG